MNHNIDSIHVDIIKEAIILLIDMIYLFTQNRTSIHNYMDGSEYSDDYYIVWYLFKRIESTNSVHLQNYKHSEI